MNNWFNRFSSNTVAGSGNQLWFAADPKTAQTGRVFYRLTAGGSAHYALLFSDPIDSTYSNGAISHRNLICGGYRIYEAKVGLCKASDMPADFASPEGSAALHRAVSPMQPLRFDGYTSKTVPPGGFVHTDPIRLDCAAGDFLCVELTFAGAKIPYHEESILPIYRRTETGWQYDRRMPLPGMVGCDRPVQARIGYLGDSITQGIGTEPNTYTHWNAVLSARIGSRFAFWNLGLGYGRADDMAADGAWLYKARQNDLVVLCAGVNDLCQGLPAAQVCRSLATIVDTLQAEGIPVVLQTVPPFDYTGAVLENWHAVNRYIHAELTSRAALCFDNLPILSESTERPQVARYGGHPDATGCAAWGNALFDAIEQSGILSTLVRKTQ